MVLRGAVEVLTTEDYLLNVVINRDAFVCSQMPLDVTVPLLFVKTPAMVSAETIVAAQTTTMVTSSIASITVSPTSAAQTARAVLVLQMIQCEFSHTAAVDLMQSPTRLRFGHPVGQYYRGGVVGNLTLLVGVVVFVLLATVVVYFVAYRNDDHGWASAVETVRLPGVFIVPVTVLAPGTLMCSLSLMIHGPGQLGDYFLGVYGLLVIVASCGALVIPPLFVFFDADLVEKDQKELNAVEKFMDGVMEWEVRGASGFRYRWGAVFKDFNQNYRWFILVEVGSALVGGLLDGIRPMNTKGCVGIAFALLITSSAVLAATLLLRPYISNFEQISGSISAATVFCASVLFVASTFAEGTIQEKLVGVTEIVAMMAIYLSLVKVILDVTYALHKVISRHCNKKSVEGQSTVEEEQQQQQDEPLLNILDDLNDAHEMEPSRKVVSEEEGGFRGGKRIFDAFLEHRHAALDLVNRPDEEQRQDRDDEITSEMMDML